jgi:hypothetical protein
LSYTGTVEHGVVKLPPEVTWSDGTKVRVEPIEAPTGKTWPGLEELIGSIDGDGIPATNQRAREVMGCASGVKRGK